MGAMGGFKPLYCLKQWFSGKKMNYFNKVLNNATYNPSKSPFTMVRILPFNACG